MLQDAINTARRSGGFENSSELRGAENLLQQLEEEKKAAHNLLVTATNEEESIDELWKRIQEAARAGVDEGIIEPARIKLVKLRRREAEVALQAAISNPGVEELTHAIGGAAKAGFTDPELFEARSLLSKIKASAARRLLREGMEGRQGTGLEQALELAREVDLADEAGVVAAEDLLAELSGST